MEREGPGGFYGGLAAVHSFARLADAGVYAPLPEGWVLGLSDIVRSTEAIEVGRYKAVNTAAAALIAGMSNALPGADFPFVFAGDGAAFAVPPDFAEVARSVLAATAAWARDNLELSMRIALVPVEAIRAEGLDVRVARYAPSANVSYAMFTGGGLAWAEREMKAGGFLVEPAPQGAAPDLTGLSCRFAEIGAERGIILSLIAVPTPGVDPARFQELVAQILKLAEGGAEVGRPVPEEGPTWHWPPAGLALEARTMAGKGYPHWVALILVGLRSLTAHVILKAGLRLGSFDPARYRRELVENTDFRKFDDGLRMTLDCTPALADRLEAVLEEAETKGIARCGSHRQAAALMTCFVPSASRSDHVHFIDGARGGYAAAARALKTPF